ncbi:hypothetical protein H0H81_008127 [Sphagnurus paluster]|uniref:N-acetyltransferase domain-containing protein n=1 Tax=Sphagnurus paluster TaxID=117069 RepID=A0A9P7FX33_9AGAR|nr:hypothetical protein H0H81_008127 [Sphagnurus paluster]
MPSLPSNISTTTHRSAVDLPADALDAMRSHPRNANIVLPQVEKALAEPSGSPVWIVCKADDKVEFVLAVTDGFMGAYPIFIFTTLPFEKLTDEYIRPSLENLAVALAASAVPAPVRRVYSVFAPEPVALVFAEEWTRLSDISHDAKNPYYAAKISYCTADTLAERQDIPANYNLRAAVSEDVPAIAELCYLFAKDSAPFVLNRERALEEATKLIENSQVWVHEAQKLGEAKEIASIVAFTRNSKKVAAITKVVTNPQWGGRGCAKRLVREVCDHLINGPQKKESVVLYVAHENTVAIKVYDRVGFVGLSEGGPKVEGVDRWLEVGFDSAQVELGHW